LQWHFSERLANFTTLEFRAIVTFMLDGVVHHTAGTWHQSKKNAQRDAAERTLGLFVGLWGEFLLNQQGSQDVDSSEHSFAISAKDETEVLEEFCREAPVCAGGRPKWTMVWQGCKCRAMIELSLLGVAHQFTGQFHPGEEAARTDAARRVLWYLRCPGFDEAYEPDPHTSAVTALPPPPANWANTVLEEEKEDTQQSAEPQMALLQV